MRLVGEALGRLATLLREFVTRLQEKIPWSERYYRKLCGNSLAVQWLGLHTSTAEGPGSVPGRGSKIPQAARGGQK